MIELEGRTMTTVNKLTDLVIVNALFIVTSLPVVTIGASASALHYMMLRLAENKEGYVIKDYFRAFKENLRKGTILWLLMMPVLSLMFWNVYMLISRPELFPGWIVGITCVVSMVVLMAMLYIFPLQMYFENTIRGTIRNAFILAVMKLPKTILMLLISMTPVIAVLITYSAIPVLLICGFSLPAYGCAFVYRGIFEKVAGR